MDIRIVDEPDKIKGIIPVIESAWGFETMESLVKDMVSAMRFHGGLVLGAYDNGDMVGMSFSFPGFRKGKSYLYSHMTGVMQDRKYSGIGYNLKQAQLKWAKENGYELIAWTFDPLMSLNANFNIGKLGAFSRTYIRNFYGKMEDDLNRGIRTDRLVAELWVDFKIEEHSEKLVFLNTPELEFHFDGKYDDISAETLALYIPEDFVALKARDIKFAMSVRESSCSLLEHLFSHGYAITNYRRTPEPHYIIRKITNLKKNIASNLFS